MILLFSEPERSFDTLCVSIESSGYQYQDKKKHPRQYLHFSFSFLGDTQMLLHILQGVKASAKRGLKLLTH
jgi:hypothetical protein